MKPDIVAFMISVPFNKRDYDRFGVELFKNKGYQVYVLDLTALLNPVCLKTTNPDNLIEFDGLFKFQSKSEFKNFLTENNKRLFVVDVIGAGYANLFIYKYFKEHDILYASFCVNSVPMPSLSGKRSFLRTIKDKLPQLLSRDCINVVRFYVSNKTCKWVCRQLQRRGIIKAPDYVLAGGKKVIPKYPLPDGSTKTIWAHALDLDIILQREIEPSRENYAVFIDEYAPYAPDLIIFKMSPIDAEVYYSGLNRFFDWFEKKFDQKVVIAADPRSRYDLKPECFGVRQIIKGKTAECIAKANCVFTHSSTARNFAVYLKKPTFFLTCDEFERTFYGAVVTFSASTLGQKSINVDRPLDEVHLDFSFNDQLYSQYVEDYIKTEGSARKLSWNIVVDELDTITR